LTSPQTPTAAEGPAVVVVGGFGPGSLEASYESAFASVGCATRRFDILARVDAYCRLGPIGRYVNRFLPVEAWTRKANRDLVATVVGARPALLVVVGSCPVRPGTLGQLRASWEGPTALLWVDSLVNLDQATAAALPLYHRVLCYGRAPTESLRRMGASQAVWLPLAADPRLHDGGGSSAAERTPFDCDVSFIGNWRPEREAALALVARLSGVRLKVWGGPDWKRRTTDAVVRGAWQGRGLVGAEFATAVRASRLNLNLIDSTTHPSANMRFFEIPCAGGLQVASACSEMEDEFKDGECVFYFRHASELPGLVQRLLADPARCEQVAREAHRRVLAQHTYAHRARRILEMLGISTAGG
jgi:spore maturation protein CgeB